METVRHKIAEGLIFFPSDYFLPPNPPSQRQPCLSWPVLNPSSVTSTTGTDVHRNVWLVNFRH